MDGGYPKPLPPAAGWQGQCGERVQMWDAARLWCSMLTRVSDVSFWSNKDLLVTPPPPFVPWVQSKCHLSKLCIGVGGGEDRAPLLGAWLMDVAVMQLVLPPSLKRLA